MKKTRIIELFKNFKKSFVTFFSIVLFVSLGLASFLGLEWSRESIADSFQNYFDEGSLHEYELSCLEGIDTGDIDFLKTLPQINEIEGRYETYRFWKSSDQKLQIHVYSITDRLNKITSIEGRMPEKDNEILVEKAFAEKYGIEIGKTIEFSPNDEEAILLKSGRFTVTGLVKTAEYTSIYSDTYGVNPLTGCVVKGMMYLKEESFRTELYQGYSSVLLRCDSLREESLFTDAYNIKATETSDSLRKVLDSHFDEKYISLTSKAANPSYITAKSIISIFAKLRIPLAGLFVIVGVLVCFFAVSRNVFDQIKLIGTKKALGFYKSEIMASLLIFSLLSSLIGIIIGTVLARYAIESILVQAIQSDYPFNNIIYAFELKDVLLFAAFEISIILSATFFASNSILKRTANSLLSGSGTCSFKERPYMNTRAYQKLSVLSKTILNNMLSEPRRTLSTIVGIMGITALTVCSLSLNNFIQSSFTKQTSEITKYDTVLYVMQDLESTKETEAFLKSKDMTCCGIMSTYVTIKSPDGQELLTSIYVVEDDEQFLKLFDLHDGKHSFTKLSGLYSSVSYGKEFHLDPGTDMKLSDAFGKEHSIPVSGYFDYYLIQNQLIIDKESFEKEFDMTFEVNSILLNRGDSSLQTLNEELSNKNGFINIDDYYALSKESFNGFAAVFFLVVGAYIAIAVLMALIVVMNLLDMFIMEKKYELIVLRINGFRSKQVKKYINVDTAILSVTGTVLGLVLGILMGNISLDAYRTASIYFEGGIDFPAALIGTCLTFVLVLSVTLLSTKKIDRFKLSDINA